MFRFVVLMATTLAVAHTQTLLYPSTIRQISLPLQSQLPLRSISLSPQMQLSPLYPISTIFRYPSSQYTQLLLPLHQRHQYIQPAATFTHTRTLPVVWSRMGRSFGSDMPTTTTHVGQTGMISEQQFVSGQQSVVDVQPQGGIRMPQTTLPVGSSFITVPSHQPSVVSIVPSSGVVSGHHHGAHITTSHIPLTVPTGQIASYPIAYSVDLPKTQQLASTAQISHLPASQGHTIVHQPTVGHQESIGHHQVSHVTIPGQVGVGGGYTSAAFFEAAPGTTGVVIPSVPLSSEPIVASDVKVASKAGQGIADQVQGVQSHVPGQHHHQTIGTVQSF